MSYAMSRTMRRHLARWALASVLAGSVQLGLPVSARAADAALSGAAREAYDAGAKAFAAGDLAGAGQQYGKSLEATKSPQAYWALGLVQEHQAKKAEAQASYRQALALAPNHEQSIVALALSQATQGQTDAALSFLRDKQTKLPASAAVLAVMAEVKSLAGDSGEAQRLAQEALKKDPNCKPAMVTLARDHYRARRIDLALYALQGILEGYGPENPPRDKANAEARLLRGLIYAERGLRGPAVDDLTKAAKARPDLVEAHLVLARFMLEAGNAKDATPHLQMAVRFDAKNVPAHLMLGDAYRLLDKGAEALKELEWVLKTDPNQIGARYNLGLVYLMSSKLPGLTEIQAANKAIEQLQAYKAKAPRGGPDDVDELIVRAQSKKALLEAAEAEKKAKK
ncbi:MAG TPA: tetratricopeptide repeat protein [Polyangiaceae bacterium]|nr:tetratricopeptide repeat protein [Polyangiaceae bacterium]